MLGSRNVQPYYVSKFREKLKGATRDSRRRLVNNRQSGEENFLPNGSI
jgi:hypothetical protein